jgi:Xaa-Pro aminopeptidase
MADTWSQDWSNPVFSLDERDRRWDKVRRLMAADGIDVIVCTPWTSTHDRSQADPRYLTQLGENSDEATVVFPQQGAVTAWHSRGGVWPSSNWLTDIRAARRGTGGQTVVERLREMGFERGTLAIAGLTGGRLAHCRKTEGEVNWQSVDIIKQAFPNARIVSATELLGKARFEKSPEEIEFLRKGAEIAGGVLNTTVQHARAGVEERRVWAHMLHTYADLGGSYEPTFGWTTGPLGNTYHRLEQPTFRELRVGDVLNLEIDGRWAGYSSPIAQLFMIGQAPRDVVDAMQLAGESFERVFACMKPGVTVGALLQAGRIEGLGGRAEATVSVHGCGCGDDGPLADGKVGPEIAAQELVENCVLCVDASVSVDGKHSYGRWGDSVVIRAGRAERLGTHRQQVYELQ